MSQFMLIFFGPKRLRSGWRILLFVISSLALATALTFLKNRVLYGAWRPTEEISIAREIAVFAVLLTSWLLVRYIDKRPFTSLGLHFHPWWGKELAWGSSLGALLVFMIDALLFTWKTGRPF